MRLSEFSCTPMTKICDNLRRENVSTSATVGRLDVTRVFLRGKKKRKTFWGRYELRLTVVSIVRSSTTKRAIPLKAWFITFG